ncbi:MAG TPA: hypothetical protein VEI02_05030, partial [Planctomycetota bacterium]|nr:hypothetical protein [Planctomycetota bacterium]
MGLVTSSVAWAARRLNPLARVIGALAAATAIGAAQERWDESVTVSGSVTEGGKSVEGATVTATPFLRPLLTAEQRLRAFRPARTSTTTRADGGFSLRLPEWTLGCDAPVAVIASSADGSFSGELHGEYVDPRRRETHRGLTPSIRKEASVRIRLVDQETGRPLGGVRVAALVCIPPTLKIPRGAGGYCQWDNLVVGVIGRTDADGWIARDAG